MQFFRLNTMPLVDSGFCIIDSPEIPSLVANTLSYFIASSQVKHIISSLNIDPIEYFPIAIYNHKCRVASRDYFIINPIGAFDCLKLETSTITRWAFPIQSALSRSHRVA